jgi:hypothetical protein
VCGLLSTEKEGRVEVLGAAEYLFMSLSQYSCCDVSKTCVCLFLPLKLLVIFQLIFNFIICFLHLVIILEKDRD